MHKANASYRVGGYRYNVFTLRRQSAWVLGPGPNDWEAVRCTGFHQVLPITCTE